MGTSCSRAIARIRSATRPLPVAATVGALLLARSYLSATAVLSGGRWSASSSNGSGSRVEPHRRTPRRGRHGWVGRLQLLRREDRARQVVDEVPEAAQAVAELAGVRAEERGRLGVRRPHAAGDALIVDPEADPHGAEVPQLELEDDVDVLRVDALRA